MRTVLRVVPLGALACFGRIQSGIFSEVFFFWAQLRLYVLDAYPPLWVGSLCVVLHGDLFKSGGFKLGAVTQLPFKRIPAPLNLGAAMLYKTTSDAWSCWRCVGDVPGRSYAYTLNGVPSLSAWAYVHVYTSSTKAVCLGAATHLPWKRMHSFGLP